MKKLTLKHIFIFTAVHNIFISSFGAVRNLTELCVDTLFLKNHDLSDESKKEITDNLLDDNLKHNLVDFSKRIIVNVDLSGRCLKGINFSNAKLIKVNLTNCDLRNTNFKNAEFYDVKLHDALISDNFRFNGTLSPTNLIKQYSTLITKRETKKASALNKFFQPLQLNLKKANLSNLNLTKIDLRKLNLTEANLTESNLTKANLTKTNLYKANLHKANLKMTDLTNTNLEEANLRGVQLSKKLVIPNYHQVQAIFFLWKNAHDHKPLYQKLINARVKIIQNISYNDIQQINWKKAKLQNANLTFCNFSGINLTGANLKNADLSYSNFRGANLTDANLKNAILYSCNLEGTRLSQNIVLPDYNNKNKLFYLWRNADAEDKIVYQKLINAKVNVTAGIPHHEIRQVNWQEIDLTNADLSYSNFNNIELTNIKLKNADFIDSKLIGTNFLNTKLKNVDFRRSNLTKVNFENASLEKINFTDCKLNSANFRNAYLHNVGLLIANTKNINLKESILNGTNFPLERFKFLVWSNAKWIGYYIVAEIIWTMSHFPVCVVDMKLTQLGVPGFPVVGSLYDPTTNIYDYYCVPKFIYELTWDYLK